MSPAIFSPCRQWRYTLWRTLTESCFVDEKFVQFIGLNPSTADEVKNDPTVRRCMNYSRAWGFDKFCMTNIFAWRDTDPLEMKNAAEPIGEENDKHILEVASKASLIICAWGNHGDFLYRGNAVREMLIAANLKLHALKINQATGQPAHPLYLRADIKPFELT